MLWPPNADQHVQQQSSQRNSEHKEIMTKSNLRRDVNLQVQDLQETPGRISKGMYARQIQ